MSSSAETKQSLRKSEFPICAKDALTKIGQLICGRAPNIKHMDLSLDLMAEFVFCEVDRRGNKRTSPFTSLLELQLLEVLFDYLNGVTNEPSRNSVFLTLFSGTTASQRLGVLSKLVSIAIGTSSGKVLISASTWMQQLGNTSPNSCKLVQSLVLDYFILVPSSVERLQTLPHISPQFAANFLTGVGELYFSINKQEIVFPPTCLLETIVHWVSENNYLCVAAQSMASPLPQGGIQMEATTPIAGLLKWCILAPIYKQNNELYSKLHLALLNTIMEIPETNPPRALSTIHLSASIGCICRYVVDSQIRAKAEGLSDKLKLLNEDDHLQITLDRFAQAVHVALYMHCAYGNIDDFIDQLRQLPNNKLLSIVINTHKRNK